MLQPAAGQPVAFADALDLVAESAVRLDGDLRVRWANAASERFGCGRAESVGRPFSELLPAEAAPELDAIRRSADVAAPIVVPSTRCDDFGGTVPVEVTIRSVEHDGKVDGWWVVARDLSAEAMLQDAVVEMAHRTDEIQSLAKVGLWVWDPRADNVQWTAQTYRLHGLEPEDFDGTFEAHLSAIDDDERQGVREAFQETLRTGDQIQLIYPIRTPAGRRWISCTARRAGDSEDEGLVGTCQDVTERRLYQEAVERANGELSRFGAALAHDLKTPLTTIVGMADVLKALSPDLDEDRLMLLDRIVKAGQDAASMIHDLLESATRSATSSSMVPVDLAALMQRVRTSVQVPLGQAHGRLRVGHLPTVDGAPALLRQLLFNLVGNAIKYRHPDRQLVVEVDGDDGDGVHVIRVVDNGLGIKPEDRGRVFSAGVRVHESSGVEGDGQGLSTCLQIVEQHGGTIRVEDGIDGGSAFVIELPKAPATDAG